LNALKKHWIIGSFILASFFAIGQTSVGLVGGFGGSQVYFSPNRLQNFYPGFFAGLRYQFANEKGAGVSLEILQTRKGWSLRAEDTSYTRFTNYIELPFLSHFQVGGRDVQFIIELGPSLSYATYSEENIDNEGYREYAFSDEVDYRFNLGLQGLIGVQYIKNRLIYSFRVRYQQDLTNMYRDPNLIYSLNQTIYLGAGIQYVLKTPEKQTYSD
jgi:hypothetical protein